MSLKDFMETGAKCNQIRVYSYAKASDTESGITSALM